MIFGIAGAFAPTMWFYLLCMFVIGFVSVGVYMSGYILCKSRFYSKISIDKMLPYILFEFHDSGVPSDLFSYNCVRTTMVTNASRFDLIKMRLFILKTNVGSCLLSDGFIVHYPS